MNICHQSWENSLLLVRTDRVNRLSPSEPENCETGILRILKEMSEIESSVQANYGKDDEECEAQIKNLFSDLQLQQVFFDYEQESWEKLNSLIKGQNQLPEGVFSLLLKKIYKRSK